MRTHTSIIFYIFLAIHVRGNEGEVWPDAAEIISRNKIDLPRFEDRFDDEPPKSMDWRTKNGVTAVKDIREYYSEYSWAFSASGCLESIMLIQNVSEPELSAQNLVDCVNFTDFQQYTDLQVVYWYLISNGIASEQDYPYTGTKDTCNANIQPQVTVELYIQLANEDHIKSAVGLFSPVSVLIDGASLSTYESGIIDSTMCNNTMEYLKHAAIVVGYDTTDDGTDYWILQNFWGPDWGEDGYFRLTMHNNTCGIGLAGIQPYIQ